MRLRSLELRNYRRHVHTRIEMPDGITALVGANGAGKSTILEALGFALFGTEALRTSKTLLRHEGAAPGDAVEVRAELELAGQAVAVHRELRGKTLTPSATLTVDGAVLVPPGAGSSEAATQQIQRRLGLGPAAFYTTLVARQGELAALATQAPADRKRLILGMLGVDRIDAAVERARQARREAEAAAKALRDVLPDATALDKEAKDAQDAVAQRTAGVVAAAANRDAARQALQAAEATARLTQQQAEDAARQRNHAQALRRELDLVELAATTAEAALVEAQAAAARAQELTPLADQWPQLQQDWLAAQQRQQAALHREALVQSVARLKRDADAARRRRQAITVPPALDEAPLAKAADAAQKAAEQAGRDLEVARAALVAAQARLDHLGHLGHGAPCPTCERPLEGRVEILQEQAKQALQATEAQVDALARALAQTRAAATRSRDAATQARASNHKRELVLVQANADEAAAVDLQRRADEAEATLPPVTPPENLDDLRVRLNAARQAHDARQAAHALAARLPGLQAAHSAAATRLATARQEIAVAISNVPDPAPLQQQAAQTQAALALAARSERDADLALHTAQAAQEQARLHVEALARRRQQADSLQTRLAGAEAELREWTALADGRNGLLERFRDHVVDRIGPAIQAEASRLLALFTGGRYSELLLDADYGLFVTDNGQRYGLERFSGGEQDVAHLALRLAVSRLLAERAGATELRFLALDEVFGSLDEERRGQVVAALHGLSGLYAQVLVVSHMAALNDALDQAITVDLVDGQARVAIRNG